jgi:uracil-DNA glycosylase family 4
MLPNIVEGPEDSKIMLVGEAFGKDEEYAQKPFVGAAGKTLSKLLAAAGIGRSSILITNVVSERPPKNDIGTFFRDSKHVVPTERMQQYLHQLRKNIEKYRPNVVVALGRTALWALTGETNVTNVRGYVMQCGLVPGVKVLPTFHPQYVNYNWKDHATVIMDLKKALRESKSPTIHYPKQTTILDNRPSVFVDYCNYLKHDHKEPVVLDIETFTNGMHIDVIGLAESESRCISFKVLEGERVLHSPEEEVRIWTALEDLLRTKPIVMQNGKFDVGILLHHNGILVHNYHFDTHVAAHVCYPELPRSLGFLSSICLNVPYWKGNYKDPMYNAYDVLNTYGVYKFLSSALDDMDQRHVFNYEMAQIYPAVFLELNGLLVDQTKRVQMLNEVESKIAAAEESVFAALGKKINLNSPLQLQGVLYVDLKLPTQYKRRKSIEEIKKVTTDAEALNNLLRTTKNPVLHSILEYKKLVKLKTYLNIETRNDKVHTCYNVTGATSIRKKKGLVVDDEESYSAFGRWSSSASIILPYGSGNLQNIPEEARSIYTVPTGYTMVQADYIQAEAVVVAYIIGDMRLMQMFRESYGCSAKVRKEKYDVHTFTASIMFRVLMCEVTPDMRRVGKAIRHALNYGGGAGVIARKLGCSISEAKVYLNTFLTSCPQLQRWHKQIVAQVQSTRVLTNLFGRKHKYLGRLSDITRSATSFVPQSTVADLMNISLCYIFENTDLQVLLQLHDAVYVQCLDNEDEVQRVMHVLKDHMTRPLKYGNQEFFIDVDFKVGKYWGNMTPIELSRGAHEQRQELR